MPCTCLIAQIQERNLEELQRYSNIDALQRLTFDNFDASTPGVQDAFKAAKEFARDPQGWLVLSGGFGAGKTHLAAAIAHELLKQRTQVLFQVVPDLLDHLKATFGPSSELRYDVLFEAVRTANVLILDDLGEESQTAWAEEKLFQLFNHRYNHRLPTVVTTNRDPEKIDQRIWSRINDRSLTVSIRVGAVDYRLRTARERRPINRGPTPRR
jgi:DNA replication protein DnaC